MGTSKTKYKCSKQAVLIIWEDAAGKSGHFDENEYTDTLICHTLGYLILKDKEVVSVSQDWQERTMAHRNNITIPMVNVKKIIYLKGGKK